VLRELIRSLEKRKEENMDEEIEIGCGYCRNYGKLDENGVCPKCDAQWLEEDQ
jgi:predicted Zn-ribbon and HTH transcriptional regulator